MMAVKGDLEGARNVLLDELSAVANMRGWTVTVIGKIVEQSWFWFWDKSEVKPFAVASEDCHGGP